MKNINFPLCLLAFARIRLEGSCVLLENISELESLCIKSSLADVTVNFFFFFRITWSPFHRICLSVTKS